MTKLKFGEKELQIKFGYEATVKSGIIKKVAKLDQMEDIEAVDEILLFLPELILVGAQKFHKEELGYNPDNEGEKEQQLGKVYAMLDDYFDGEDADVQVLYNALLAELLENGFYQNCSKQSRKKRRRKLRGKVEEQRELTWETYCAEIRPFWLLVTKGYGFTVHDIDTSCPADLQPYADVYNLDKSKETMRCGCGLEHTDCLRYRWQ